MSKRSAAALASAVACLGLAPALVAAGEVNTGYFGNVAIKGYDTVAYFTEGRAVKGHAEYTQEWLGAQWRFSSAENRRMFAESPIRYMPQYGGYCAVGVSIGERSHDVDPEAFTIVDGKLYLNYSESVSAMLTPERIEVADKDWAARPTDAPAPAPAPPRAED